MARYLGPSCKLCRASGEKLFLKGSRCTSSKCAIERRNTKPGSNRPMRSKDSEYALQLKEKQKLKRTYGLLEKQFYGYYEKATAKDGITGDLLIQFLERRLDNIVYRIGLAKSRSQARQFVRHGHIRISNDKLKNHKVDIPSYLVNKDDIISFDKELKLAAENIKDSNCPDWISKNGDSFTIVSLPNRDGTIDIDDKKVIGFYSR